MKKFGFPIFPCKKTSGFSWIFFFGFFVGLIRFISSKWNVGSLLPIKKEWVHKIRAFNTWDGMKILHPPKKYFLEPENHLFGKGNTSTPITQFWGFKIPEFLGCTRDPETNMLSP